MASANQYDRPHRSSNIPREQRERERAERHAQRASQAAAAAAAGGSGAVVPPSPAHVRDDPSKRPRQSDLPSASNVAIVAGRQPGTTSQPQPKRASSNQAATTAGGVSTPGVYPYQQNPYATINGSDRYGAGGNTPEAYDPRAATGQSVGGPNGTSPGGGQGDRRDEYQQQQQQQQQQLSQSQGLRQQGQGQQMANGEYLDHEDEEGQKKGMSKLMQFLTCRCA